MNNSYNYDTFHGSFYGGSKRFAKAERNALIEGKDYVTKNAEGGSFYSDEIGVGAADNILVQGIGESPAFSIEGRISDTNSWAPVIVAKVGDKSEKSEDISDNCAWVADVHNFYQVRIKSASATESVIVKLENLGIK